MEAPPNRKWKLAEYFLKLYMHACLLKGNYAFFTESCDYNYKNNYLNLMTLYKNIMRIIDKNNCN